jgi:hypothetical protein
MKINDKVLCIDGSFKNPNTFLHFQNLPVEGKIYTVRDITYSSITKNYRVLLKEISNKKIFIDILQGYVEPGFDAKRFVPLSEIEEQKLEVEELVV